MAKVDFNTQEHAVGGVFALLPKGRYLAVVEDSELKDTQDRRGKYYAFEFSVLKGPEGEKHKGRKLWANLNVHNPSETAQRIGREQFNGLCHAVGRPDPSDTVELHGRLVVLIVDVQLADPKNPRSKDQNRVAGYLPPTSDEARTPVPAKEQRPAPRQAAPQQPKKPAGKFDDMEDDIPF